jgi:hypothetical protein
VCSSYAIQNRVSAQSRGGKALEGRAAYHILLQSLGNDVPVQVRGIKSIILGC